MVRARERPGRRCAPASLGDLDDLPYFPVAVPGLTERGQESSHPSEFSAATSTPGRVCRLRNLLRINPELIESYAIRDERQDLVTALRRAGAR